MRNKKMLSIWRAMHNRCYNENQKSYVNYGGRGIVVDPRWHGKAGYEAFVADMGLPQDEDMIERTNNNGPYGPANCKWATRLEQSRNKRNTRLITANGKTKHLAEWARELGCSPSAILARLKAGMSEEEAVTKPIPSRPNAKLTMDDAIYVRQTYPMKTAQRLAEDLGVSKKTVLNIIHNVTFISED
jgi:hypothetical protein